MKIKSAYEMIYNIKKALPDMFSNVDVIYEFGEKRPFIGDDSNEDFRGCLGGNTTGEKSGIYIFSTRDDEVIYIGKATKNNLHNRVWDHLGTAKRLDNGWMTFPETKFQSSEPTNSTKEVIDGNVRLHIFTVSDPDAISIIEVYLQVAHIKQFGRLPEFNKQIG